MIVLSKLIIFLFVLLLFIHMVWINSRVLNKFFRRKSVQVFLIGGLGLILVAAFLDMISNIMHIELRNWVTICFTIGISIFSTYMILWINQIVKVMSILNKNANNDSMTGLYNRKGFEKVFKREVTMKKYFYIMVFDLDKTKIINDNFGHQKGDKYIISAAKIIKDKIGQNGFVGRTGGDEFIALVENINQEEIENIKASIKNSVSNIFHNENTQVSIGYSKYKRDGVTFKELLSFADKRMYEDKRKGQESLLSNQEIII